MNCIWKTFSGIASQSLLAVNSALSTSLVPKKFMATLLRMHQRNMERLENPDLKKKKKHILDGKPFAKGLILKTLVKKPRKPNSANRKCVLVKLSTGREMFAYVPGIGHNLQEHQTVLCKISKLKDTPGVKLKCVRGKYDLPHVKAKK